MPASNTGSLGAAVQDILSRGLDAASAYYSTRLTIANTAQSSGPTGSSVQAGTSANFGASIAGVPAWAWIGGALLLGVVVVAVARR